MDAILVALVGGSIGAILTNLGGVPTTIKQHNRAIAERDDDLAQWVSDECVQLERHLAGDRTAEDNVDSSAYLRGIAHRKEDALHRYRDQERAARQVRAMLQAEEGVRHRIWRRVALRGALPELQTPSKAGPILDGWRAAAGMMAVSDPTRRPLEPWAVEKYGAEARPWDRFLPPGTTGDESTTGVDA
jgi:hypothetical protein